MTPVLRLLQPGTLSSRSLAMCSGRTLSRKRSLGSALVFEVRIGRKDSGYTQDSLEGWFWCWSGPGPPLLGLLVLLFLGLCRLESRWWWASGWWWGPSSSLAPPVSAVDGGGGGGVVLEGLSRSSGGLQNSSSSCPVCLFVCFRPALLQAAVLRATTQVTRSACPLPVGFKPLSRPVLTMALVPPDSPRRCAA